MTLEPRARVLVPDPGSPLRYAGTVEHPETYGVAGGVAGAVLVLRAQTLVDAETGMVGSLERTLRTDAAGAFDGLVLPGAYEIEITPSEDPELGVLVERRSLVARGGDALLGHVFRLPARTVLGGLAQAPGGAPFEGAVARAIALGVPLEGLTDPSLGARNRSSETVSGPTGAFRLALDVGRYDLVFEPPPGSGYPWWVEHALGIGSSGGTLERVVEVRAPVWIETRLETSEGTPLADAEVRAWADLGDGVLVPIGRAWTDGEGRVALALPPTL